MTIFFLLPLAGPIIKSKASCQLSREDCLDSLCQKKKATQRKKERKKEINTGTSNCDDTLRADSYLLQGRRPCKYGSNEDHLRERMAPGRIKHLTHASNTSGKDRLRHRKEHGAKCGGLKEFDVLHTLRFFEGLIEVRFKGKYDGLNLLEKK